MEAGLVLEFHLHIPLVTAPGVEVEEVRWRPAMVEAGGGGAGYGCIARQSGASMAPSHTITPGTSLT